MKKTILSLFLTLATITICEAQQIEMKKAFGGYQYTQNRNIMTMGDLVNVMESNPEAQNIMKKANSNNVLVSILGGAGGALIGYPIGTSFGGGDANWTLAAIGVGLVAVAIPISSNVNKSAEKAVELYNSSLNTTSFHEFKPEFNIVANGKGIGLSMNF